MAANSKIEWCDHTFNPWEGCTKVSAGCANCYAETRAKRFGTVKWGPQGTRRVASESYWRGPLKWDRAAAQTMLTWEVERWQNTATPKPERPRVFCASLADVFEDWRGIMVDASGMRMFYDGSTKDSWEADSPKVGDTFRPLTISDVRTRLFDLINDTPNLDWLLLTKRPENVKPMLIDAGRGFQNLPPWFWLGTSVENQQTADERIPHLLNVPAAVRFLSVEPLLGPVSLDQWLPACCERGDREGRSPCPHCIDNGWRHERSGIHWVIVGGESGPGARPCRIEWIRDIVAQCKAAAVPCFVKQLGSKPIWEERDRTVDQSLPQSLWRQPCIDPKGGDPDEWTEDLRVREFPQTITERSK